MEHTGGWAGAVAVVVLAACAGGGSADPPLTTTTADVPTTTLATTTTPTGAGGVLDGIVVVVDPGHNGRNAAHTEEIAQQVDAGGFSKDCNTTGTATDGGYPESRFNFAVATLLQEELSGLGASIVLTRDDDDGWGPCIDERGLLAGRVAADVLISIHADGAEPPDHGFHVIHPALREGYVDQTIADRSAALAMTMRDALTRHGLVPSTYRGTSGLDQRADLGTLNRAGVPAVIVESGNLRNPADAAMLTSTVGQNTVAGAIVAGLVEWVGTSRQ